MDVDTLCPVCRRMDKGGAHCFLKCKQVKACWRELNLEHVRCALLDLSSAKQFVKHILDLDQKELVQVACLLWAWWDTRNKVNAGEQIRPINQVIYLTNSLVNDCDHLTRKHAEKPRKAKSKWSPPPPDILKINCDASFQASSKSGSWGFLIRNHHGEAVLAAAGSLPLVHDVLCAEAQACLQAVQMASAYGMTYIQVELDSLVLVQALTSISFDQGPGGVLFKEIRAFLALNFGKAEVLYKPRSGNVCAHELARYAVSRDPDQPNVWTDPLPEFVSELVARDITESTIDE
ncbi:hypothetical protein PR202_gb13454 [Eleusine coracana subsp. coracana]|uniref:RNase H type-1 domain-containing protein n=1 Tax=Eleusine coracana subsp. coracana TaxID=191504 RepID=A0AAV5EU56_ELECO|nr:hypothetical protein PR202_gb13454 [Eleusine coracana subsp. coracana]